MSIILRVGAVKSNGGLGPQYGSGDDASSSYSDADVLDIPLPEHTYQRPLPPPNNIPPSNATCFGLPYQDHNYGMPPPPSPPRAVSPRPTSPVVVPMEVEVTTQQPDSVVEEVVEDSITRCICGYLHDDGYMICCDKCSVWQHIDCMGVDRSNIPDSYFCEQCEPRTLDAVQAKIMQKRKREELAARNVLSDSSATDTDPEEANNALASLGKKLPVAKRKALRHKASSKLKEKSHLKLKVGKSGVEKKSKKPKKKEKENIKASKSRKVFKTASQRIKSTKTKNTLPLPLDHLNDDPWNCTISPWIDAYEHADTNQYSIGVQDFFTEQSVDSVPLQMPNLENDAARVVDIDKDRKGVKTCKAIPAGQAIMEYTGNVMLKHDYDKEHTPNSFRPFVLFYSKLDVDICIDAHSCGNDSRFIRRSCSPNSEVLHTFNDGKVCFFIVSQEDIANETEMTIPFDYNYEDCSFSVECACTKSKCTVSQHKKKVKQSQKSPKKGKQLGLKKRRQSNVDDSKPVVCEVPLPKSPVSSPKKGNVSPAKVLQTKYSTPSSPPKLNSPVKLNVSTLLAAAAISDDLEVASTFGNFDNINKELSPKSPPLVPPKPLPKAISSRRSSKAADSPIKEDKISVPGSRDKIGKLKEPKLKEKEKDHVYHNNEVKKERKPALRRQSQDDSEVVDIKNEVPATEPLAQEMEESSPSKQPPTDSKKLTREEKKLAAIMKAFEKMEKRQERKSKDTAVEPTTPPAQTVKKGNKSKVKKKEGSASPTDAIPVKTSPHDGPVEEQPIKSEAIHPVDNIEMKSPDVNTEADAEVKSEEPMLNSPTPASPPCAPEPPANNMSPKPAHHPTSPSKVIPALPLDLVSPKPEASPQKGSKKSGKRKRRRSRVQSNVSDNVAALTPNMDNSMTSTLTSSNAVATLTPSTSSLTPVSTPVALSVSKDTDDSDFKFVKTKKHLFTEWSNKHDDESKQQQEMFVQCIPSPHVNTMDHLQRRNSHSGTGYSRTSEVNTAGSAKKRWLRQAMHEVPSSVAAPNDYKHSLSVSTDVGDVSHHSYSPAPGSASPNLAAGLGSPRAASPLDFVTPLKKRRLMRESLSNDVSGPVISPGPGVMVETAQNNSAFASRTNGIKPFFPPHRHSTDDRLLLHKNYPLQNGAVENNCSTEEQCRTSPKVASQTKRMLTNHKDDSGTDSSPSVGTFSSMKSEVIMGSVGSMNKMNGLSGTKTNITKPQSSTHFPLKLRHMFDKMEVDSSAEIVKERRPSCSTALVHGDVKMSSVGIPLRGAEEDSGVGSSAATPSVVVVNSSSVYNGVDNLIEENSEASCVTTKSIMDVDSPATVCIDLNTHEMEPSSLSDNAATTSVVNLNDTSDLFNLDSGSEKRTSRSGTLGECHVNSSEDIVNALPLPVSGRSIDSCDTVSSESSVVHVDKVNEERRGNAVPQEVSQDDEHVDSSQHASRFDTSASSASLHSCQEDSNVSDLNKRNMDNNLDSSTEGITSSGHCALQTFSRETRPESSNLEHVEVEGSFSAKQSNCDSVIQAGLSLHNNNTVACVNDDKMCDSVSVTLRTAAQVSTGEASSCKVDEEIAVSENAVLSESVDGNVDSTCSDSSKDIVSTASSSNSSVAADNFCDSNFERIAAIGLPANSRGTNDDSCHGVSSSNVLDHRNSTFRDGSDVRHQENASNSVLSSSVFPGSCSPTISSASTSSRETGGLPSSPRVSGSVSGSHINSGYFSSSDSPRSPEYQPLSSPSSLFSSQPPTLPTPHTSDVENNLSSTTPGLANLSVATTASSSISSSEAAPAGKKKVSLNEYRKRLKEKPAATAEPRNSPGSSSSSLASTSSLLSTTSLHRITFSSSRSDSSPSSSLSPSRSNSHRKQRMPTLATLPLFKSSDSKKETKKTKKPEKQLSLTERLRLEFGVEDCGGEKQTDDESEATALNKVEETPPPPPPPPNSGAQFNQHPNPASHTFAPPPTHMRHGAGNFIGSTAPNLVNGGNSSQTSHNFHQQPCISSTSVSHPPPPRASNDRAAALSPRLSSHSNYMQHTLKPSQHPSSLSTSSSPSSANLPPHVAQTAPHSSSSSSFHSRWSSPGQSGQRHKPHSSHTAHTAVTSQTYDYNHRAPAQGQAVTGNVVPSDQPPPPPPPQTQTRPHRSSNSSSLSSPTLSLHRHHQHHSSSGKSLSNKAASSSSSRYL